MAKYQDTNGMGKSALIPKVQGEPSKERHQRRKNCNLDHIFEVANFCRKNGIVLHVTNDGHHWQAIKEDKQLDWWPSSAKAVYKKNWGAGIHVHDWKQFIALLRKKFKIN